VEGFPLFVGAEARAEGERHRYADKISRFQHLPLMQPSRGTDGKAVCAALIERALQAAWPGKDYPGIVLDRPKDPKHGDYACNIAMQLARTLKRPPREIADTIVRAMPHSNDLEKAEVAGAGFINLFLKRGFKHAIVGDVLAAAERFGHGEAGRGKRIQVEFVSANPTGPLHVGHGRGAAFGASLANVLEAAGFGVTREYYVNDAGRQMDILAVSTWLRYLELLGEKVPFPPNAYQGDYVIEMAKSIREAHGSRYAKPAAAIVEGAPSVADEPEAHLDFLIARARAMLGTDYDSIHAFALNEQLADCRSDLTEFGVVFDEWFSERSLYDQGLVAHAVKQLTEAGHAFQKDGALWFRSTQFGDEKDRVIQRENGQFTYFASDIAYHVNKLERGNDIALDVWGSDHHGYIPRVRGALQALGLDQERLEVALVQFAVLYRHGEKVSMSTRAGEFVTLRELRREVGNDAARFFYVLRKSDQHLDFDLDLAKSQSNENPVYYIQYAHARVCRLHEQWGGDLARLPAVELSALESEHELALLEKLAAYPDAVENAARDFAPHVIAFYLKELAGDFHSYYNATRILVEEESVALARLALATAVGQVLRNGLALLGVSAPERM
jgi:arginyl-tRNA synthetase